MLDYVTFTLDADPPRRAPTQGFARIRPPGRDGGNGTEAFGTDVETELQSDSPDRSTLETHAITDPAIPAAKPLAYDILAVGPRAWPARPRATTVAYSCMVRL
jgi:hypothetical protein